MRQRSAPQASPIAGGGAPQSRADVASAHAESSGDLQQKQQLRRELLTWQEALLQKKKELELHPRMQSLRKWEKEQMPGMQPLMAEKFKLELLRQELEPEQQQRLERLTKEELAPLIELNQLLAPLSGELELVQLRLNALDVLGGERMDEHLPRKRHPYDASRTVHPQVQAIQDVQATGRLQHPVAPPIARALHHARVTPVVPVAASPSSGALPAPTAGPLRRPPARSGRGPVPTLGPIRRPPASGGRGPGL